MASFLECMPVNISKKTSCLTTDGDHDDLNSLLTFLSLFSSIKNNDKDSTSVSTMQRTTSMQENDSIQADEKKK